RSCCPTLGRHLLPYLFPKLSGFATEEDLDIHLRTSDARYRSALPAEFLDRNPPLMYITLYFIVTRLPDSLRAVRDHFLTVNLLEKHLLIGETSIVAQGQGWQEWWRWQRGWWWWCRQWRQWRWRRWWQRWEWWREWGLRWWRWWQRWGWRWWQQWEWWRRQWWRSGWSCLEGRFWRWPEAAAAGRSDTPTPQHLRVRAGQPRGKLHTLHRCFSRLDDAWRAEFGDEAERPRWAELLRSGVVLTTAMISLL
ncbi:unnamed protein product, partial [Closterium sp. NIES-53]